MHYRLAIFGPTKSGCLNHCELSFEVSSIGSLNNHVIRLSSLFKLMQTNLGSKQPTLLTDHLFLFSFILTTLLNHQTRGVCVTSVR